MSAYSSGKLHIADAYRKPLIVAACVLVLAGACIGAYMYFHSKPQEKLSPMTRIEMKVLLDPRSLSRLSKEERAKKLLEYGQRLGMISREERTKILSDPGCWHAFFSLSPEERINLMFAAMTTRIQQERPKLEEFFSAPPEKQEEMLDNRIDRVMWIRAVGKGLESLGLIPPMKLQQKQMRDFFRKTGRSGRKKMLKTMLNVTRTKDRAMLQEYRRRLINRAKERGIDFRKLERGG